jgi:proteasome lid subunit RPN8/RPN11
VTAAANLSVPTVSPKENAMIAPTVKTKTSRSEKRSKRMLRFTPYAWAKLLYLRDLGPTEVGGFGIANADDLLLVEDIELVQQDCTAVSVEFDDDSVADYFDRQVDVGRKPEQFARIWIHTHPGTSPAPSVIDEETFERCFGGVDWAVMFILAQGGNSYARAQFNIGPGTDRRLRCRQEFDSEFPAADHEGWFSEYCENVQVIDPFAYRHDPADDLIGRSWWESWPSPSDQWSDRLIEVGQ